MFEFKKRATTQKDLIIYIVQKDTMFVRDIYIYEYKNSLFPYHVKQGYKENGEFDYDSNFGSLDNAKAHIIEKLTE